VSTKDQDPEKYKQDCINFAKEKGWEIVDIVMEKASAYKDITREGYEDIIERAKRGEFKHIIVWDMSRWSRKPPLEVLKELRYLKETYGVKVHSVKEPILEFLNADDDDALAPIYQALYDLLTVLISWQNNMESERKSTRIKLTYEKKKKLAENLGKRVRWGRESILKKKGISEEDIINDYKNGMSYRKIGKKYGISYQTVANVIKKAKEEGKLGG